MLRCLCDATGECGALGGDVKSQHMSSARAFDDSLFFFFCYSATGDPEALTAVNRVRYGSGVIE